VKRVFGARDITEGVVVGSEHSEGNLRVETPSAQQYRGYRREIGVASSEDRLH
jgi:hypothetical protein